MSEQGKVYQATGMGMIATMQWADDQLAPTKIDRELREALQQGEGFDIDATTPQIIADARQDRFGRWSVGLSRESLAQVAYRLDSRRRERIISQLEAASQIAIKAWNENQAEIRSLTAALPIGATVAERRANARDVGLLSLEAEGLAKQSRKLLNELESERLQFTPYKTPSFLDLTQRIAAETAHR